MLRLSNEQREICKKEIATTVQSSTSERETALCKVLWPSRQGERFTTFIFISPFCIIFVAKVAETLRCILQTREWNWNKKKASARRSSVLLLWLGSLDEKHMLWMIVMIHFLVTEWVYKVSKEELLCDQLFRLVSSISFQARLNSLILVALLFVLKAFTCEKWYAFCAVP